MTQLKAHIFLSDLRFEKQTPNFRSYSTVVTAQKPGLQQADFPEVGVLNDVELAGAAGRLIQFNANGYLILLPVTGDLTFMLKGDEPQTLEVGTLKVLVMKKGETLELHNPFDLDVINYLELQIHAHIWVSDGLQVEDPLVLSGLEGNDLLRLFTGSLPFQLGIGRFKGRQQVVYETRSRASKTTNTLSEKPGSNIFCFVIAGAFEVQERLLHMRDGLSLSPIKKVEFEALSDNAILLIVELFGYQTGDDINA